MIPESSEQVGRPELRGGSSPREGNVFINGAPVCDDHWTISEGNVVCQQLGLSLRRITVNSYFGTVSDTFGMDDVNCEGSEERLEDCSHVGEAQENCRGGEAAGVVCFQGELFVMIDCSFIAYFV